MGEKWLDFGDLNSVWHQHFETPNFDRKLYAHYLLNRWLKFDKNGSHYATWVNYKILQISVIHFEQFVWSQFSLLVITVQCVCVWKRGGVGGGGGGGGGLEPVFLTGHYCAVYLLTFFIWHSDNIDLKHLYSSLFNINSKHKEVYYDIFC